MLKVLVVFACSLFVTVVAAQPFAALPRTLNGKWTYVVPGGRTFIDSLSLAFDGGGEEGTVSGRLTHRGVSCGALDEPFTATWNGSVLRIESRLRANVNTARNGGTCADKIVYTLKPSGKGFEGEAVMDGFSAPALISLSS